MHSALFRHKLCPHQAWVVHDGPPGLFGYAKDANRIKTCKKSAHCPWLAAFR